MAQNPPTDKGEVEFLKDVLRQVEFFEYHDPEEGLQIWCEICGGEPKKGRPLKEAHLKDCEMAIALYGKER